VSLYPILNRKMPTATKMVKGKKYLYFTYYDQQTGKKKEVYCGLETDNNAKRKAMELELDYLENQTMQISKKKDILEKQLSRLK